MQPLLKQHPKEPMSTSPTALERLARIGFTKVGLWQMNAARPVCQLHHHADQKNVLYAFVVDDVLQYVGKTTQPLKKRMYGYQNPGKTQSTNIKNNANITAALGAGKRVDIYALPDSGLWQLGGFHVNMAAGLEDAIVRDLAPPWNQAGTKG
jgi:hypothetical protein